jgi:hypothetical protein
MYGSETWNISQPKQVGAETVTYVSNIYKYYIAYRLIMDSKAARGQELAKARSGGNNE